jgi:hypothetical protein
MSLTPSFTGGVAGINTQQQSMPPDGAGSPIGVGDATGPLVSTAPPAVQLFGMVCPGCPVRTDFVPADASGLKFAMTLTLPVHPALVSDLVFFFLPGAIESFPPQHGALLYWQATTVTSGSPMPLTETTGFELLGAISPDRPSAILRTSWATNDVLAAHASSTNTFVSITITLGVSIEPLPNISNLQIAEKGAEDRLNVAKKIAKNLFTYMQSFDDTSRPGWMTVPTNVFQGWLTRFENKSRVDPNFFMKSED